MPLQRAHVESALTRSWLKRGWLAVCLWPLSILFKAVVAVRRSLYASGFFKTVTLPVPVIIVGNIFVGGTGKTPFTIWLVQALVHAGYTPGVISRGYGVTGAVPYPVTCETLPQEAGDEPVLIACRAGCPVMVGRDRPAAAAALLSRHPEIDVIVSDDGLQHYALGRTLEIIVCDGRGDGNGWMLPAGPLRESASRRRDFTIVNAGHGPTNPQTAATSMRLVADGAEQLMDRSRRMPLHMLADLAHSGKTVIIAAAGIGNPTRFFAMLRDAGLQFGELPLPDHYDFQTNPFAGLVADIILITEKDAVKCSHIDALKSDPRLWVVPVTANIEGSLADRIVEKLRGHTTA